MAGKQTLPIYSTDRVANRFLTEFYSQLGVPDTPIKIGDKSLGLPETLLKITRCGVPTPIFSKLHMCVGGFPKSEANGETPERSNRTEVSPELCFDAAKAAEAAAAYRSPPRTSSLP